MKRHRWTVMGLLVAMALPMLGQAPDQRPSDQPAVPDLSEYDRDTLQVLCEQLYQRVAQLKKTIERMEKESGNSAVARPNDENGKPTPTSRIANQNNPTQVAFRSLGIQAVDLKDAQQEIESLHVEYGNPYRGVMITEVDAGSPADRAGLKKYDVIDSLDGRSVRNLGELVAWMVGASPGQSWDINIKRVGNLSGLKIWNSEWIDIAIPNPGIDHPADLLDIQVSYDRFNDGVSITSRDIPIALGEGQHEFSLIGGSPGKTIDHGSLYLIFHVTSVAPDWKYLQAGDDLQLICLVDGNKVTLPLYRRTQDVGDYEGGICLETMSFDLSLDDLERMAEASSIECQLFTTEFSMTPQTIEYIRKFYRMLNVSGAEPDGVTQEEKVAADSGAESGAGGRTPSR